MTGRIKHGDRERDQVAARMRATYLYTGSGCASQRRAIEARLRRADAEYERAMVRKAEER